MERSAVPPALRPAIAELSRWWWMWLVAGIHLRGLAAGEVGTNDESVVRLDHVDR